MDRDVKWGAAIIGGWYQTVSGELLEIVAMDDDGTIVVQYFDCTVAEIDPETWQEMTLGQVPAPEDFSGSLELTQEEYGINTDYAVSSSYTEVRQLLDS